MPVIVTLKLIRLAELQDSIAVPEPVTPLGEIVQARPVGKGVTDKETEPLKPLRPVTVIIEVVGWPTFTTAGGVAARLKSVTVTGIMTE